MSDLKLRNTAEVEEITGVPAATLRYWRHKDFGPPSVRLGKRVFYREDDVISWVNEQFEAEAEKRATA